MSATSPGQGSHASGQYHALWVGAVGADVATTRLTREIRIGSGGTLVVTSPGGNITIPAATATTGAILPIQISALVASGSTAHTIFCLY